MKKTKIICTVGPASLDAETILKMWKAGMNGARINTAYGDLRLYKTIVENVRDTADIPIIIDVKGPDIRLRAKRRKTLANGDILEVGFRDEDYSFNHDFYDCVDVGDTILIDNGKIRTVVAEKRKRLLRLSTLSGGEIENGKGVNIPNKELSVPTLSKSDYDVLKFAVTEDIEFLALSYTRSHHDIRNLRRQTKGFEGKIIAKIENAEGLRNLDAIMNSVDSILIARGDLGVEIEPQKVPLIQKSIIRQCNNNGKTVVTATEMLESMISQPTPTRAEVSDVANAILDGTDTMMLSGETAVGKYPFEAVTFMTRIAEETEPAVTSNVEYGKYVNISDTVSKSIQNICENMSIGKIVTLTRSGYTAKMVSRFKVKPPIIAVTPEKRVKRELELVFGVCPVYIDYQRNEDRIMSVAVTLRTLKLIKDDDTVLFTAAFRTKQAHASNLIEIHNIKELLEYTKNI